MFSKHLLSPKGPQPGCWAQGDKQVTGMQYRLCPQGEPRELALLSRRAAVTSPTDPRGPPLRGCWGPEIWKTVGEAPSYRCGGSHRSPVSFLHGLGSHERGAGLPFTGSPGGPAQPARGCRVEPPRGAHTSGSVGMAPLGLVHLGSPGLSLTDPPG